MFSIRKSMKLGKRMRVNYSSKSGLGLSGGIGPLRFNTKQGRKRKIEDKDATSISGLVFNIFILIGAGIIIKAIFF